jgi:cytochrome P450
MRNDWSGVTFPHPTGRWPMVGDLFGLDRQRPLAGIMAAAEGQGPIFEMRLFDQKFVFITGVELAEELCDEKRFHKNLPPALVGLRAFAGDGLFTAYDHETNWQLAHDLLMPAFTKAAMQRYHPVMLQVASELFDYWDRHDGPVDVSADMTRLTMETIGRTSFGQDFGSFEHDQLHPFVDAMVAALRAGQASGAISAMPGSSVAQSVLRRRNAKQLAYAESFVDDIIAARRLNGEESDGDLLGIMLNNAHPDTGERLDDLNIRRQILTFLVAGHETTSGALSFTLYYLATHPDVLRHAQQEADAILGSDRDTEPTYEQVPRFRVIRRCLDEALRLWPTAPGFGRSPRHPTTLGGRWRMRPDDWAIVLLPMVHRDPSAWGEDAAQFDPDRFLPERSTGRNAHAYRPFGTGQRACIGRQFALHEAVLVLAGLLHRYNMSADTEYQLQVSERLTLMPEGFELALSPRNPTAHTDAAAPPAANELDTALTCPRNGIARL